MIHVVKASEAQPRKSFDVAFDLLAIGPRAMITKMHYRPGNCIPFHAHPNEQSGYIASGRVRVLTRDSAHELATGDSYVIPANVEHSTRSSKRARDLGVYSATRGFPVTR